MNKQSTKILTLAILLVSSLLNHAAQATEVYFEKSRDLPLVYVNVVLRGGGTQDPEGKSGATDVMTRLLLRGTRNKTKQQINLALDQLGANLGVETRAEFVAIRGNVIAENVTGFLSLIEEILSQPSFQKSEFEKLKKEQISQLADELSSDRALVKLRFEQNFFKGHPYARPNVGKIKEIQGLSIDDMKAQYQKIVNPKRMLVLANGDTSETVIRGFVGNIEKKQWANTDLTPLPQFSSDLKKTKIILVDKPDVTQTQIMIGQRGIAFNSPDIDALQLANFAFGGGGFSSRLMVELRVKRGWTYGAGSGFKFGTQPHSWRMSFSPKNSNTPPAIKEALDLVRQLKDQGITKEEFEFAKQSMINSSGFAFDTPAKRMENRMNEILFGLPEGYYRDTAKRLAALSYEQVNQALKNFVDANHLFVAILGSAGDDKTDPKKTLNVPAVAQALNISVKDIEVVDFKKE